MKRILLLFFLTMSLFYSKAEDVIQVIPFATQPGVTSDDMQYFDIEMRNTSDEIWAFQFDILLPKGMQFDTSYDPFELCDRMPHTTGRGGVRKFKHVIQYKMMPDGYYRIVVFTTDADRISDNNGPVLRAYYLTDSNMETGIHPIHIKGTVMTVSGNSDIQPATSSSYCIVGDSPLKNMSSPDLSKLSGYIPSWVATSISNEIATNYKLVGLYLNEADKLGSAIELPNKNALCFIKSNSECKGNITNGNVILCDESYTCDKMMLHDGDYNLYVPETIISKEASFNRIFKANIWATICLPFAVSVEEVKLLRKAGVIIEQFSSLDVTNNTLHFEEATAMEANTPYIIKCNSQISPFTQIAIDKVESTLITPIVESHNVSLIGTYDTRTLNSSKQEKYYVFDSSNGNFVLVGNNCKVQPFRAYIKIPASAQSVRSFAVVHSNKESTLIDDMFSEVDDTIVDVYTIDGIAVRLEVDSKNALIGLPAGIYIIGNKKYVVH